MSDTRQENMADNETPQEGDAPEGRSDRRAVSTRSTRCAPSGTSSRIVCCARWPNRRMSANAAERDRRESERYGGTRIVRDLLPVYDNLAPRARQLQPRPRGEADKALMEGGSRLTLRELLKVLTKHGVTPIVPEVGDQFDPQSHEAMFRGARARHQGGARSCRSWPRVSCCMTGWCGRRRWACPRTPVRGFSARFLQLVKQASAPRAPSLSSG